MEKNCYKVVDTTTKYKGLHKRKKMQKQENGDQAEKHTKDLVNYRKKMIESLTFINRK